MDQETFLLKWKFHSENITHTFENDNVDKNYADVTLLSDELIEFKVHKFVLSANSPVLKDIFMRNSHPHPLVYLNVVKEQEMRSMLQLMYFGETMFYTNRMEILLRVIEELKLSGFEFFHQNS